MKASLQYSYPPPEHSAYSELVEEQIAPAPLQNLI